MNGITEYINKLIDGCDLSFDESREVLDVIFEGEVDPVQIAAFLTALRAKDACVEEIAGLAVSLRDHALRVDVADSKKLIDTCGTGGAAIKTFNISTAAAFVAAGAGAYVAKHGNRSVTSLCGSADVLEELGVNVNCGPAVVENCIEKCGIGFMFAPAYHPATKNVQPVRKKLGFRTVFNLLGPLANPARVDYQVLGVAEESMMPKIASALTRMGIIKAMVVHSEGLDEISTFGKTKMIEIEAGNTKEYILNPGDYNIEQASISDLKGGSVKTNAAIIRNIIEGKRNGPCRDVVVLNAAAAIKTYGLAADFCDAIELANNAINDKTALETLEQMIHLSNLKDLSDV